MASSHSGDGDAAEPADEAAGDLDKLADGIGGGDGDQRTGPILNPHIDLRIARDGSWFYHGSPISRKPLVRLFSTVLRREEDGKYYLVTPVEKARVQVDDAPFTAVALTVEGADEKQRLTFRTNLDDEVTADAGHPIRLSINSETGEPTPYVLVRDNLEALISRAVYYDLVDLGVGREGADDGILGVWSGGSFFELGRLDDDEA